MKIFKAHSRFSAILALSAVALTGCLNGGGGSSSTGQAPVPVLSVNSVSPASGATDVATNAKVVAAFAGAVDANTIDTFSFVVGGVGGGATLPGTVSFHEASNTAIFTPAAGNDFAGSSDYEATITTAVKDQAGKSLANDFVWQFKTAPGADNTAPTVVSTNPADGEIDVRRDRTISATFDEALDPATITDTSFYLTLLGGGTSIPSVVSYVPGTNTATFNPSGSLSADTDYTATLTAGVKDSTTPGNALVAEDWSFKTGNRFLLPVDLGTAGDFVILAKSAISTTGKTAITGDLGVSPAATSYITGFSLTLDSTNEFATSDFVTGKVFAADMEDPTPANLTTAIGDMVLAYTDAAGRSNPDSSELGAGNISGMTLAPGLHKWGTGLEINTDVTLSGDAQDVWIFQIAQDLTVANGVAINLSGGALPENIFWQVAGGVTLGTTADFKGIILTQTNVVMNTGTVLHGRALAQTAVTLDATTVTAQ